MTDPTTPGVAAAGGDGSPRIPVGRGRSIVFRVTWLVLTVGWACLAVLYAAYLALVVAGSPFACPDPVDDSTFGEAQWSWEGGDRSSFGSLGSVTNFVFESSA